MKRLFTILDYGQQVCKIHCDKCSCVGAGKFGFPDAGQNILTINNVPVNLGNSKAKGTPCVYGCEAEMIQSYGSAIISINNVPLAIQGQKVYGNHGQYPLQTITQHIVYVTK